MNSKYKKIIADQIQGEIQRPNPEADQTMAGGGNPPHFKRRHSSAQGKTRSGHAWALELTESDSHDDVLAPAADAAALL